MNQDQDQDQAQDQDQDQDQDLGGPDHLDPEVHQGQNVGELRPP